MGKTQSLGTNFNVFDEDKISLSKIGNVNFFFPFGLLNRWKVICIYVQGMNSLYWTYTQWILRYVGDFYNTVEKDFWTVKSWQWNVVHIVQITSGIFIIDYRIKLLEYRDKNFSVIRKTWWTNFQKNGRILW